MILEMFSLFCAMFRVERIRVLTEHIQSISGIVITLILLKICFLNCFSPMTFYQKLIKVLLYLLLITSFTGMTHISSELSEKQMKQSSLQ